MKRSIGAVTLVLAGLGLLRTGGSAQVAAQVPKAAIVWPAEEIAWSDNPAMPGAKIAVLWGDPRTGAYGALKRIPAGSVLPPHTHTHDERVITLSGTLLLSIDGRAPAELGPGSHAFIPGGVGHAAECAAGGDCAYFAEQPGASDITFIGR